VLVDARSGNAWITAADLDGDGKDEVLFAGDGPSQAFRGDGTPVATWPPFLTLVDSPIAVGDVFGDGHEEVAFYNRFFGTRVPRRTLALRAPDRSLLAGWPRGVPGSFFTNVGMADLTGDGQLDLVVLKERRQFARPGAHAFTAQARTIPLQKLRPPPGVRLTNSGGLLSFADLDGDGHAEGYLYGYGASSAVFGPDSSYVMTLRERRLGAVAPPAVHQVFAGEEPGATAIGDIDGDGEQELVTGVAGQRCNAGGCFGILGRRAVLVQHRDGSLDQQFPKPVPEFVLEETDPPGLGVGIGVFADDPRYGTPAIADLAGDGLEEVLWVDPDTSLLLVWDVAGAPAPEHADWPMFRHDPRHTNVLPLP
jgi:hypothetical protein